MEKVETEAVTSLVASCRIHEKKSKTFLKDVFFDQPKTRPKDDLTALPPIDWQPAPWADASGRNGRSMRHGLAVLHLSLLHVWQSFGGFALFDWQSSAYAQLITAPPDRRKKTAGGRVKNRNLLGATSAAEVAAWRAAFAKNPAAKMSSEFGSFELFV